MSLLMRAMIERCRDLIREQDGPEGPRPPPLRRSHLHWMCDRMIEELDDWSSAKLNRWVGFLQCALIANGVIDLDAAKEMFARAKVAFGEPSQDLLDHLDPRSGFEFELGGEG